MKSSLLDIYDNNKLNMKTILLLATTNRGKIEELASLLESLNISLVTPDQLHFELEVEENGCSYEENAVLKATAYSRKSGLPALADDTGLEVDALDGQPGLFSARFVDGHKASDWQRRLKLLSELLDKPQPWHAKFRCCVALALPDGEVYTAYGEVAGQIITEDRGQMGFGYDPLFFISQAGKTMAECTLEEKNQLSHRALAVKAIIPQIRKLTGEQAKS